MIKRFLLSIIIASMSVLSLSPMSVVANTDTFVESDGESDVYSSTYIWYYKEENGKKYMRLWDRMNYRWVTDWILVEE